jgi:hypothetical protein
MHSARDQLLAGAGFASDQQRRGPRGVELHQLHGFAKGRAVADKILRQGRTGVAVTIVLWTACGLRV